MNSIKHIENALKELDDEVQALLLNWDIPLNEKDNIMLPILQQKKSTYTNFRGFNIPKREST